MVNSSARYRSCPLGDEEKCLVVDDFLEDPALVRAFAKLNKAKFGELPGNSFPGPEFELGKQYLNPLADWWRKHGGPFFGVGQHGCTMSARFSIATKPVAELSPGQRLPHIDSPPTVAGKCRRYYAGVLYLFDNPPLGGTCFFRPRRGVDVSGLFSDVAALSEKELQDRYPLFRGEPSYPVEGNRFMERVAAVEASYNRCVFYPSDFFHTSDIQHPELLKNNIDQGRLTVNIFIQDIG